MARKWLSPHQVRAMRRLRREGHTIRNISRAFAVSFQSVSDVVNGKSFRHVPNAELVSPHIMDGWSLDQIRAATDREKQTRVLEKKKRALTRRIHRPVSVPRLG